MVFGHPPAAQSTPNQTAPQAAKRHHAGACSAIAGQFAFTYTARALHP
jgi:hypothetical protein